MNSALPGFTVTYSNITGLITIANSSAFLLDFTTPSSMYVVLGFLPQLYPTTTSITAPYALNLGMPTQLHIYISKVVNNYIGVQGGYNMPTFIVPVDASWGTIVNFRSKNDYSQYVVAFFTLVLFQRQKRTCFKNFSVWPLLQKQEYYYLNKKKERLLLTALANLIYKSAHTRLYFNHDWVCFHQLAID